ncbi:hypothetical protein OHB11_35070 [Streptomyces zaomyceticus]|uniref:Uncharacterized protein n=1 Tax=Streptomyces zaomyceticus TaxID=68286 RepID=A0ABZ1LIT8_9ACTN|nr:hypothetical protein OG237_04795 [Streptomyces zaomyceticus]
MSTQYELRVVLPVPLSYVTWKSSDAAAARLIPPSVATIAVTAHRTNRTAARRALTAQYPYIIVPPWELKKIVFLGNGLGGWRTRQVYPARVDRVLGCFADGLAVGGSRSEGSSGFWAAAVTKTAGSIRTCPVDL